MLLVNSIELILYKAYADLRAEAARSYLGVLWWVIEPVLYLGVFYVLFVLILQRGGPDFVSSFLCGAVVWKWFDNGVKGGGGSIGAHAGLLQQVYVPKYVFPIISVLVSTAKFIPVFGIFTLFLVVAGAGTPQTWAGAAVLMCVQFMLVLSVAMLVGAITPFVPDLKVIIENGLVLLFFLSGVFFDIGSVEEPLKGYLMMNPMASVIHEYRNVMLRGIWPDLRALGEVLLASAAMIAIAGWFLSRLDHRYGKVRF